VKEIKLEIHSMVDLITNSSTEIFISANDNAEENVKKILQKILDVTGSTKKVDDVFEVKVKHEDSCFAEEDVVKNILTVKLKDDDSKDSDIIHAIFDLFYIDGWRNG
jgi:hypothetical protein